MMRAGSLPELELLKARALPTQLEVAVRAALLLEIGFVTQS